MLQIRVVQINKINGKSFGMYSVHGKTFKESLTVAGLMRMGRKEQLFPGPAGFLNFE